MQISIKLFQGTIKRNTSLDWEASLIYVFFLSDPSHTRFTSVAEVVPDHPITASGCGQKASIHSATMAMHSSIDNTNSSFAHI